MDKLVKLSVLGALVASTMTAQANVTVYSGDKGTLDIGGDVEYNVNYQNKDYNDEDENDFSQDGRLLLSVHGKTQLKSGHYAEFKADPTLTHDGEVGHDDAWFAFGKEADWKVQMGDFEAYDLFPLGQDTYLTTSTYQVENARGRGMAGYDTAGHVMYAKEAGNFHFETGAMMGDVKGEDNAIFVRPVLAHSANGLTLAAGVETDVNSDTNPDDEIGYGARASYSWADNTVNLAAAQMDAGEAREGIYDNDVTSATLNGVFGPIGLGYFWSSEDADGSEDEHAVNASYKISDVMAIDNFDMYLGAYHTQNVGYVEDKDETGLRTRFKYVF